MEGNGQHPPIVAKIEIVLMANGQIGYAMNVPSRYVFNAMMETAKQNMLGDLMKQEMQKVKLPDVDVSRLKI